MIGDFLVRPALRQELKNLAFAGRQKIVAVLDLFVAYLANVVLQQHLADHGTEERFPFRHSADGANQICLRGVLQDVGVGSGLESAKNIAFVRMHAEDYDARPRFPRHDLLRRFNTVQLRHSNVENGNLRVMLGREFHGFPSIAGLGYNFEIRLLFE